MRSCEAFNIVSVLRKVHNALMTKLIACVCKTTSSKLWLMKQDE